MKLYAEISKSEKQDDGTIKVWGYASSEAVDSDGEVITADAMKAALPDYMKFGAVREMHQPSAAGTAIEATVEDDGRTFFGAHVVDPIAVKKVETGVYKGFSIGGKVTGRDDLNKAIITGIRLVEVSLVDRPANPEAVFTCYKADGMDEEPAAEVSAVDQLAELLNKGEISPERLLELAKGAAPAADDAEHDPEPAEEVQKGMWSVQDMAGVLSTIGWICRDAQDEADWEGDASPIPAALRAWFAQGAQIFQDMAAEELAEMLAQLKAQAGDIDVLELAARGADLAKAGAKFSAATKSALKAAHDACKAADKALGDLGYDKDGDEDEDKEEEADKAAGTDDLAKAAGEIKDAYDAISKAAQAAGMIEGDVPANFLSKLAAERDSLTKRVAELEAKPAPGKALLKAIAKGDDVAGPDADPINKVEPVTDHQGDTNEVASLIKMIHRGAAVGQA